MEETLSPRGPVDSEHAKALWGQCRRYHTKLSCNNQDNLTQEQLQVILHYPDQGDGHYASDPAYGKKHELQTADICEQKVKFLSKIAPRFQADLAG